MAFEVVGLVLAFLDGRQRFGGDLDAVAGGNFVLAVEEELECGGARLAAAVLGIVSQLDAVGLDAGDVEGSAVEASRPSGS